MPPEERDAAYLLDLLQAAEAIGGFLEGRTAAEFRRDEVLRAAVERKLIVVGEAVRKLSESFKSSHAEVSWRQIAALRNVLVHEYDRIRSDELWEVCTIHLPRLVTSVRPWIPPLPLEP
ncbi:MAG: DUF86 domain-containing protein [Candidatus Lambdaproteobacteria bacterium]|nr:DUF86 domain-containing protein [Candidatus Lambdaproteobacteria bacterium]